MQLRRWSHSTLNTLLDGCAWQVYLEKFVGLTRADHPRAASGTAYHAALELHEESRRLWHYTRGLLGSEGGAPQDVMRDAGREALAACNVDWEANDQDVALDEVNTAIAHWWAAPIPEGQPGAGASMRDRVMGWVPRAVEKRFVLWMPQVTSRPTVGFPDVAYDGVVVDQKSAKNFSRYSHDGSKVRLQGAGYARACVLSPLLPGRRSDGWPRAEFHVARVARGSRANFEPVRVVAVQPDDSDMLLLDHRTRQGDERVADGRFDKNPGWFLCKPEWCAHHKDAGGPCDPEGPHEFPVDVTAEPVPVMPF